MIIAAAIPCLCLSVKDVCLLKPKDPIKLAQNMFLPEVSRISSVLFPVYQDPDFKDDLVSAVKI